jgi:hypothetical protein
VHPPRHRASPSDDGDRPAAAVSRHLPSAPNIYTLRLCARVIEDLPPGARQLGRWLWRITDSDWWALRTDRRMNDAIDGLSLWGVAVETVPDGPGRLPELVWVVSARVPG